MMASQVLLLSQTPRLHRLRNLPAPVLLAGRSSLNCRLKGGQRQVLVQLADD